MKHYKCHLQLVLTSANSFLDYGIILPTHGGVTALIVYIYLMWFFVSIIEEKGANLPYCSNNSVGVEKTFFIYIKCSPFLCYVTSVKFSYTLEEC